MKTQKLCTSLVVVAVALTGGFLGCDEEGWHTVEETKTTRILTPSEAYISRGEAAWQKGDYDRALANFSKAIELNPDSSKSQNGVFYSLRSAHWKSEGNILRFIEDANRFYVMSKGIDFIPADSLEAALYRYDRQIAKNPDDCGAYIMRSKILIQLGKPEESLSDIHRAVYLEPEFSYALAYRGWNYESQQKFQAALNNYNKALRLDPHNKIAKAGKKRVSYKIRAPGLKQKNYMFHDKRTGTYHGFSGDP